MNYKVNEFTKLSTSEEEIGIKEQKVNKENYKKFFLFATILFSGLIIIIWIISLLVSSLFEHITTKGEDKISIIINIFNKNDDLQGIFNDLLAQTFSSYEIILTKNFESNIQSNYSEFYSNQFKMKKINITIIQYQANDTNLKIKIDSASYAKCKYILFLDIEEKLPKNTLENFYYNIKNEAIDIIQINYHYYYYYKSNLKPGTIIHQPEIFDYMFYLKDKIGQTQFYITGSIIKKELFLNSVKDIDNYYLKHNNILFDESMILFKLFKRAESFKIEIGIKAFRKNKIFFNLNFAQNFDYAQIKDILIYSKFLIQNTDDITKEKNIAAQLFIKYLIKKTIYIYKYDTALIELLDEVITLYLDCTFISESDKNLIVNYRKKISDFQKLFKEINIYSP